MLHLLQQTPIVVDVGRQAAAPARDISIDVVLGIFALAGVFLAAAAIGSIVVGGAILLVKRWRDVNHPGGSDPSHTSLRI